MNVDIIVIIVGILSLIIGGFIGAKIFKVYTTRQDKKILENAEEVLSGKRDNKIKIDGEEYDATKFRVRDEDDKEITIDLKGGGKVKNGRRQEDSTRIKEISDQDVETPTETGSSGREISGGIGKKKRTSRIRSIFSRTRRFG